VWIRLRRRQPRFSVLPPRLRCVDAFSSCGEGDVEVDLWPQVERGEALDIFREIGLECLSPMPLPYPSDEGCESRAEGVLWNEMAGRPPNPPRYPLVCNVRPGSAH